MRPLKELKFSVLPSSFHFYIFISCPLNLFLCLTSVLFCSTRFTAFLCFPVFSAFAVCCSVLRVICQTGECVP